MCSSSTTRQNEQKPTTRPVGVSREVAERHAAVLELGEVHLARPRVGERRFLDREDVVDLRRRRRAVRCVQMLMSPRVNPAARSLVARSRRRAAGRTAAARAAGSIAVPARARATRHPADGAGEQRRSAGPSQPADAPPRSCPRTAPRRRRRTRHGASPIRGCQRASVGGRIADASAPSTSTSRSGANGARVGDAIQRAEHVAAVRVHPRRRRARPAPRPAPPTCAERLERRDATMRRPCTAPALNGRDADPQAGERARARRDGEQIDRRRCGSPCASASVERARPAAARRASARHRRAALVDDARDRRRRAPTLPCARRRIQSQHTHRRSLTSRLQNMSTSATPAMRQYLDAKQQHRDAILFFRMGDFYEMFYEDALVAARALELTLTSRSKDANGGGIPMCGVPFHAVDGYIARLVKKGFRVAICDQVEDPRKAKGLVKREVVRVVSPGTLTDAELSRRARAGVPDGGRAGRPARGPADVIGVALLDVSTGEFTAAEYAGADGLQALADELAVLRPREIIVPGDAGRRRGRRALAGALAGDRRHRRSDHAGRRLGVRRRSRAAHAARSAARRRPRRLRPRRPSGARSPPPARSCTTCARRRRSTSRTCARSPTAQRADALLIDPTTLKHLEIRRGLRGRPRRLAARRARSHGDVDRQPAAARLAAAAAGRARADSRSARRGRGARVPHHRPRQVPRRDQGGPGPRAARGARRARHRRPARSRRPEAVADRHPARAHAARRAAGAARPLARRRSSTTSPTSATRIEAHADRRSAGAGARRRLHPRRRRRRARRAAHHQPIGQAGHRRDGRRASARAPASPR